MGKRTNVKIKITFDAEVVKDENKVKVLGPADYECSGYPIAILFCVESLMMDVLKQALHDIPAHKRATAISAVKEKLGIDIPQVLAEVRAELLSIN